MKTEFKAKFLQHIKQKKQEEEGFTLIELLVVIIIIGILAAIALPNFLNQANRAKQTEATNQLGAVNRAQQAYRLDHNQFATAFGQLELGLTTATENYSYVMVGAGPLTATARADATDQTLNGFAGSILQNANDGVVMEVCEGNTSTGVTTALSTAGSGAITCP